MSHALPRSNFNSSALVRLLTEFAGGDAARPPQDFAERLAAWFDVSDAITLAATLSAPASAGPVDLLADTPAEALSALQAELARVRAGLANAMTLAGEIKPGQIRIKSPVPTPEKPPEHAAEFLPWHRYYLSCQRDMESRVAPLRGKARKALTMLSPALQQLAALDTALSQTLAAREMSLLTTVPLLLQARFDQLRAAGSDGEPWQPSVGWLWVFSRDLQRLLAAELDLRLQPVLGLMDALSHEVAKKQ